MADILADQTQNAAPMGGGGSEQTGLKPPPQAGFADYG
jgi:hypothetical protein